MKLSRLSLLLHFGIKSFGWINAILIACLLSSALAWIWVLPEMQHRLIQEEKTLSRLHIQQASAEQLSLVKREPSSVTYVTQFDETLPDKKYRKQQLGTIFDLASKAGLAVKMAEYKLSENTEGDYLTYRISLPVRGSYLQIRQFVDQVLLASPTVSLDDVNFKRDNINNPNLESRITFTLFFRQNSSQAERFVE